jgi:hypothetical protein
MNKFIKANPSIMPIRMEEIINECRLNVEGKIPKKETYMLRDGAKSKK